MFESAISMLRVADARRSKEFYTDALGFTTTWDCDPGDGYPVFLEVSRDRVSFHLSEHEGDGPPGVQVYVNVKDAPALFEELSGRGVATGGPPEHAPWDHMVFTVEDPDGNVLRFGSPVQTLLRLSHRPSTPDRKERRRGIKTWPAALAVPIGQGSPRRSHARYFANPVNRSEA